MVCYWVSSEWAPLSAQLCSNAREKQLPSRPWSPQQRLSSVGWYWRSQRCTTFGYWAFLFLLAGRGGVFSCRAFITLLRTLPPTVVLTGARPFSSLACQQRF